MFRMVFRTGIENHQPPLGFNQPLYPLQLLGTALLLAVIVFLNWSREKAPVVIVRPLSVAEVNLAPGMEVKNG